MGNQWESARDDVDITTDYPTLPRRAHDFNRSLFYHYVSY